jgi:hypothetical protein
MEITDFEARICLIALDRMIKEMEFYGIDVSSDCYALLEKLAKGLKSYD